MNVILIGKIDPELLMTAEEEKKKFIVDDTGKELTQWLRRTNL